MSTKQFFIKRYKKLGWKYRKIKLRRAIRINTMNTNKEDIIARLESLGVELERINFLEDGFWICKSKFSVGATAEYLLGLYSIQEAASQIPVTIFSELMDRTVLDACASPGIKTTQLADNMKNSGVIVALEIKKRKMFALINQIERCQVKNTLVFNMDAKEATKLKIKFDCILLDLPCSGNPITDRNWFNKRTIKDVHRNALHQKQILVESTKVLKEGGEIVYATCSLEPEENEFNIDWAITNLPLKIEKIQCYGQEGLTNIFGKELDDSIKNCKRIWPIQTQGFFICKFKKQEEK
jgi:NOL1/NOP2/sun family putative RNA methylase